MKNPQNKAPSPEQEFQNAIIIDAIAQESVNTSPATRICWNTGEQKNCAGCYLSKGCKAK